MGVTVIPYLTLDNASQAIEFYKQAFGAEEIMRLPDEDGKVSHAELRIGEATIYVSDEYGGIDVRSPKTIGGSPVMIVLDVEDVDALFQQAVNAGASVTRPLQDSFEGKLRTGKLIDPFGHVWMITTQRGTITAE